MKDQEGHESYAPGQIGHRHLRRGGGGKRLSSRFAVALAAVTVVGTLGLAIPGGSTAGAANVAAKSSVVNLTWWTMWSGTTVQLLNQMVTQFNKTHPGVHVTETRYPERCHDEHRQAALDDRGRGSPGRLHGVVAGDRLFCRQR